MKAKEKSKAKKKKAQTAADNAEALARRDLSKMVLHAYENEYADRTALWQQIERKAQGTVAVAGIMLAGGLAFAAQIDPSVSSLQSFLFIAILITLLFSIWQCVKALKITTTDVPPSADDVRQLAEDALRFPEKSRLPDLVNGLRYGLLDAWSAYNQALDEQHSEKAFLLGRSQSAILFSALLIAMAGGVQVWRVGSQTDQAAISGEMHNSGMSESSANPSNRLPRTKTGWQEPARTAEADRTDRGFAPDRTGGGSTRNEQQRLSAASSFRPVR